MEHIIAGIFGTIFSLAVLFAAVAFFALYMIGKSVGKVAPFVAIPLVLVGLLVVFPKLAPWFRKRWNMAADSVRPEHAEEGSSSILYREEYDAETGEVIYVPVS